MKANRLFAYAATITALIGAPTVALAVVFTKSVTINGNATITGSLSKGSGTFVIDHPLDPRNKLLYHSFVESPDAKNLYDGITTLDENGNATIALPAYFDALNEGARYQLQPIGSAMPYLHVGAEEANNQFRIAGGKPGGRVSWQLTGIRHDPYIVANPIRVEVEKGPDTLVGKGECIYEPACAQ